MEKTEKSIKFDPDKEYSASEIQKYRLIPWARQSRTITKIIKTDFFGENLLKAKIHGMGYTTQYVVKGENIIRYTNKYGSAPWDLPKQKKWKKHSLR